jgi:ABC-type oligopeptide transport system ATPase subunit
MAIFAYDNRTRSLDQVNQSNARRLSSEDQIALARHEHSLADKERYAARQEYDSLVVKQKLTQDFENEKLRQELEELKRQSSAYLRAQHQFTQGFSNAAGQFVHRVVVPTVNFASKPFTTGNSQAATQSAPDEKTAHAKVFPFAGPMDLGAKAAS